MSGSPILFSGTRSGSYGEEATDAEIAHGPGESEGLPVFFCGVVLLSARAFCHPGGSGLATSIEPAHTLPEQDSYSLSLPFENLSRDPDQEFFQ